MNLTDAEQQLIDQVVDGRLVDLAKDLTDEEIDEDVMRSWGESHDVRAEVVRDILRGRYLPAEGPDPRALRLRGAWILGRIDLDGINTTIRLELSSCYLPDGLDGRECVIPRLRLDRSVIALSSGNGGEGAVRLLGAHITGGLALSGSTLTNETGPALYADGMIVDGGAFLDGGFRAIGHGELAAVSLLGAHIIGQLGMSGATLTNQAGPALIADRATIDGEAILNGAFRASGENGAVQLLGTRITSQLDMSGATLTNEAGPGLVADYMTLHGSAFLDGGFRAIGHGELGAVRLGGAHITGQLDMSGATLSNAAGPALHADGLTVDGDAFLNGTFTATGHGPDGAVRLLGAHIAGQLGMSGATLSNEAGPALIADGGTLDGGVLLGNKFTASGHGPDGALRLLGAHIAGQLRMSGATLSNAAGPALHADGLTVDGDAFLNNGFTASGHGELGAVRLGGAHITGQLNMSGATLTNETGPALSADVVTVDGGAFLYGTFTATGRGPDGAVRLLGAHIAAQLVMSGATLTNGAGPALHADGLTVDGDAFLNNGFTASGHGEQGAVRLRGAHITGQLWLSAESVGGARTGAKWIVDGLTYDGYPSVGFDKWLKLLQSGTPTYRPQPYRQLAAAARAAGHDDDARRALMAQRDDQVRRGDLTRPARAWARFTKLTLGYGYQPWRALVGVALVLLAAVTITFSVPGALAHTGGADCTSPEKFQIAVDMAIPLVSTSSNTPCHITATPGGEFVAWASMVLTLSGWALTALFAAGFTRAIRQP